MNFKLAIILSIFLFTSRQSVSQSELWSMKLSSAIHDTDHRIFGQNPLRVEDFDKVNIAKSFSTYFDFSLSYNYYIKNRIRSSIGLQYSFEWNNSYRPYNHCDIQGTPCDYVALVVDGYSYHMMGIPLSFNYSIPASKHVTINIGADLNTMFRFLSYYDSRYKYLWRVDFLYTELTPKLGLSYKQYELGVFTRLWQYRKSDRIIYPDYSTFGHPVLNSNSLDINPMKLGVYAQWSFGKSNQK